MTPGREGVQNSGSTVGAPTEEVVKIVSLDRLLDHQTPVLTQILGNERLGPFMEFHCKRNFLVAPDTTFDRAVNKGSQILRDSPDENSQLTDLITETQTELQYRFANRPPPAKSLQRTRALRFRMSKMGLSRKTRPNYILVLKEERSQQMT